MYTLSQKALTEIEKQRPAGIISELALALHCSEGSINRYIRENDQCDELTKYAALEIIRQRTDLDDKAILVFVTTKEHQPA